MPRLERVLKARGQDDFAEILKAEITALGPEHLPLQQGLSYSSYALSNNLSATILRYEYVGNQLQVKAGLFYNGIIAGCSCADDPTPQDLTNEYCEISLIIDNNTAETTITLVKK